MDGGRAVTLSAYLHTLFIPTMFFHIYTQAEYVKQQQSKQSRKSDSLYLEIYITKADEHLEEEPLST